MERKIGDLVMIRKDLKASNPFDDLDDYFVDYEMLKYRGKKYRIKKIWYGAFGVYYILSGAGDYGWSERMILPASATVW